MSRSGPRGRGLPCRRTVSHRCWSVKKIITFGRSRVKLPGSGYQAFTEMLHFCNLKAGRNV